MKVLAVVTIVNYSSKYDFWILWNECKIATSRHRSLSISHNFCDNDDFNVNFMEV